MRHAPFVLIGLLMLAGGLQLRSRCDLGPLGCTDHDDHHDRGRRFTAETPPAKERRPAKATTKATTKANGNLRPRPRPLAGPREPSGAVALPTLGGLLVVDDEPKDSPSMGIHFLRVKGKRLVSLPVRLPPGQRRDWDDLEGATATADHVYLLGSHAHRDAQRSQLCRFPIHTTRVTPTQLVIRGPIHCWGGPGQRRRLEQVLDKAAGQHGFRLPKGYRNRRPKKGGLNLEGLHYDSTQKRLWLGLRSPLAEVGGKRYAIVLSARITAQGMDLKFGGLLDLNGRGIRALSPGPGPGPGTDPGRGQSLLIIAGGVGKAGRFDLYRIKALPNPPFRLAAPGRVTSLALALARFPRGFHPEALAQYGDQLYIFSDSGQWPDDPAQYLTVPSRTLATLKWPHP